MSEVGNENFDIEGPQARAVKFPYGSPSLCFRLTYSQILLLCGHFNATRRSICARVCSQPRDRHCPGRSFYMRFTLVVAVYVSCGSAPPFCMIIFNDLRFVSRSKGSQTSMHGKIGVCRRDSRLDSEVQEGTTSLEYLAWRASRQVFIVSSSRQVI